MCIDIRIDMCKDILRDECIGAHCILGCAAAASVVVKFCMLRIGVRAYVCTCTRVEMRA